MKLQHIPTGITGIYLREIPSKPFRQWTTWIIKTIDGREYFAPKNEFRIIS